MSTVCRSVEFGLHLIGVWPGTSISRRFSYISLMALFQIFQYRYLIAHFSEQELSFFMDALSTTMAYSSLFIKLIILAFNARLLDEVITRVIEDWKERDASDKRAMIRMAYVARRFSNLIIFSNATAVLFYAAGTFLIWHKTDNQTNDRDLLIRMELPFDIESESVYVAVLVIQFVHQISVASILGVLDCLLLTLVLHACGQIDIVRQKLGAITRKDIERNAYKNIIKILIIRHQKIISFSKNIEALFSNIALVQFLMITLISCCLGFLIMISINLSNGSTMLVKCVLFYAAINTEVFIFCFVGEYLSSKSNMIGDAVYESLWYDLKPSQNRDVFFMIVRSQKHLKLTAGKFVDLSLRQFSNIMKASASYVSVLHAMY